MSIIVVAARVLTRVLVLASLGLTLREQIRRIKEEDQNKNKVEA
jgi:hypothetical protein